MTGILQDGYCRKVDYLRISVTDRCNLRCIYCMPEGGVKSCSHEEILSYEEILAVVDAALELGIDRFRLTGGEPLVRKGFPALVEKIASKQQIRDLALTTNGTMLKFFAADLKKKGLRRVNISLDTLDHENFYRITRTFYLRQVLEGIEAALEAGLEPVKLNVVVMKENFAEIKEFVKMTLVKPLHVRFIEFMPIGNDEKWGSCGFIPIEMVKEEIRKVGALNPVERIEGSGPAKYYRLPEAVGTIGFITPMSEHFCGHCNRLRLTADGKLRACLTLNAEVDLREILRSGGNKEELKDAFKKVIQLKPQRHNLGEYAYERSLRRMPGIGG